MSASMIVPGPALVMITFEASINSGMLFTKPNTFTCMPSGYDLGGKKQERGGSSSGAEERGAARR